MGIEEISYRQILIFYVGRHDSVPWADEKCKDPWGDRCNAKAYDGLPGVEEALQESYPKADVQHCVIH